MNPTIVPTPKSSPRPISQIPPQQPPSNILTASSSAPPLKPQINQATGKKKQIRHKFTSEEDEKIARLVEEHGRDWRLVANEMPGLNSRQCRERYVFYLDPNIANQDWSDDDMQKLTELVSEYGKTWTKITQFFPNRSVINVKNQWQKMMRHKHVRSTSAPPAFPKPPTYDLTPKPTIPQFLIKKSQILPPPTMPSLSVSSAPTFLYNSMTHPNEEEPPFFLTFDDFTPDLDLLMNKSSDIGDWFY